jgi:preprotein translocase subunit SecF
MCGCSKNQPKKIKLSGKNNTNSLISVQDSSELSVGAIIGIVVASLLGLLVLVMIFKWLYNNHSITKNRRHHNEKTLLN